MHLNINNAVSIIAGLSLLLGLSIGQLHRQHKKIKTLESNTFNHGSIYLGNANGLIRIENFKCRAQCRHASETNREMEELRAHLDMERARMEMERAKLAREIDRFLLLQEKLLDRDLTRQEQIVFDENF